MAPGATIVTTCTRCSRRALSAYTTAPARTNTPARPIKTIPDHRSTRFTHILRSDASAAATMTRTAAPHGAVHLREFADRHHRAPACAVAVEHCTRVTSPRPAYIDHAVAKARVTRKVPAAVVDAAAQVDTFISKFDAADRRRIRAVRRALRRRLPTAHEMVYDNYNFFVIGYSGSERPSDAILS